MPYNVFMHFDLLELMPDRGVHRRKIMEFIYLLRDHPETRGDFAERDAAQRALQVKIIGGYAAVHWVDDAVRATMITDIRLADR